MSVRRLRTVSQVLISIIVLAAMLGCSSSNGSTADKTAKDQEVKLKFIWWGKDQRKQDTLKVIALYEKQHPNVHIMTEDYSVNNDVATQLAMETADQATPDIIQGDYSFIFDYINRDLIEPLNPYIKNKTLSTSDIAKSTLLPGMKGDELFALNIGMNSEALLYDPEFFQEAGLAVPSMDYTIDELHTLLTQLKETVDTPDFYPLGNMFNANYYLRTRGASMFNAAGTNLGYDDDTILSDYLSLYKQWYDEGLIKPDSYQDIPVDESHPVISRQSAFYFGFSNNVAALSKLAGHTIKLLPLPVITEDGEGRFIKPSMFLAVSSYSKYPEEAVKFLDFFVNNAEANDILQGERGIPVSKVISAKLSAKADETGKQQLELIKYLNTHSAPIDAPAPGNSIVVSNSFLLILKHVVEGSITPEQGAKFYRSEATGILQGSGTEGEK
ncbi:ABC transporter substrate-binding protein [Paenibacillus sp. FSL R7-0312]|uniref:ABC transporter substrate-binding protein n=1 Tax=Paenibacillus sp. FSL R7-0312 TaxID=2921682 RepID=UPI0030F656BE